MVALILSTGVIVHARWQYQDPQLNDDLEVTAPPSWRPCRVQWLHGKILTQHHSYTAP